MFSIRILVKTSGTYTQEGFVMDEFNNNNNYTNNNSGQDNNKQSGANNSYYYGGSFNGQNNPQGGYNNGNNMNEFYYKPGKPKKPLGRKILTGIIAVLSVAAIATASIVGYTLVTGDNIMSSSESESSAKDNDKDNENTKSTVDRSNLPTITQLSTPEDAKTIPEIVEEVSPSVVGISCITDEGASTGSGIILSEDGYIITNAHVIDDAKSISVVLPSSYAQNGEVVSDDTQSTLDESGDVEDNLTFTAEKVGSDEQTDIAVLKIEKNGLTAANIGTSSELVVGEVAIVIGNPLGLDLANSVTAGIISALDRTITVEDRTMNLIQTDASVNNGNSGGPLINAYGQVIGITSAKVSSSVAEGLGFAIPIDDALPIINDLMEHGYVTGRPSLGITGSNVTSAYSSYYGIPQGFLVASVSEGSGAEKAGIQQNDIIIAINDTMITSISELNDIKNKCSVGDTVTLTIYRNGKKLDVDVVLGESSGDLPDEPQQEDQNDEYDFYGYNPFGNFGY